MRACWRSAGSVLSSRVTPSKFELAPATRGRT
jgi:hypothetical protein